MQTFLDQWSRILRNISPRKVSITGPGKFASNTHRNIGGRFGFYRVELFGHYRVEGSDFTGLKIRALQGGMCRVQCGVQSDVQCGRSAV